MSRLFIPPLGTKLRLTAPWSFVLHREARNRDLFKLAGWDRANVRVGDEQRASRSEYRDSTYPNGWDKPCVLGPPVTRTRYDFGEPITEPAAVANPTYLDNNGRPTWSSSTHVDLPCVIEGTEVVLTEIPPDLYRVTVTARVRGSVSATVTIPAGSVLSPDRYYIRNGANDFDSVTFRLQKPPKKRGEPDGISGRFWAKLRDANQIEFELVEDEAQPWWHGVVDRLGRGEEVRLVHDVAKVPGPLLVRPLSARSVIDLPDAAWLTYAEGSRVCFWLRDRSKPFTDGFLVPGSTFGTGKQFRGDQLPVSKVCGYVAAVEGL